jgi:DNA-binding NtrC family response regulator
MPITLKNKHVLVIDDEPGLLDLLAFELGHDECVVTKAGGGKEALKKAEEQDFDLAICDIMMPEMGGIKVLEGLKEIQPEMEVIMATGFATLETAVAAMKAGAFDYVTKPYELSQIRVILEKALQARDLKQRYQAMEEMNRIKSEFLLTQGRELAAPANDVLESARQLLSGVDGTLPATQTQLVRQIEVNAQAILRLIKKSLDFAKSKS